MYPVTDTFLQSLARSGRQRCYVEVLQYGESVAVLDSTTITDPATGLLMQSIEGSIQVGRDSVRRSGTVTFINMAGTLSATAAAELFKPLVSEIRPWIGIELWNAPGIFEYVPVATLVVTDLGGNYPTVVVTGYDRMWLLDTFTSPYAVPAGTNQAVGIRSLLSLKIPAARLDTNIPDTEYTLPALLFDTNSSIPEAAHKMAETAGWQLYCDPLGVFTATDEPSTDDDPVAVYAPGPLNTMMRPRRGLAASQAKNAVVYTSEGSSNVPFRGYAEDTDPSSLTYVGAVGVRADFQSSPFIGSTAQANHAARTALNKQLGLADSIVIPIVPNPAHESGDVVAVADPDQDIGFPVIVDSFDVNLKASAGAMELTCRNRVIR
jgi:hypothetical protein